MGFGEGSGDSRGKTERVAVPAMPMPLAVLCCILNFLVPGLGTIIAGFSVFCCSRNEDMAVSSRIGSCCISFAIGFLQLLTVALLLFGWIWSCIWGVFFLGMSAEYYHDNPPDDQGRVITQQPVQTTVVVQPGPAGNYPYGPQYQQQQQPQMYPGNQPQPYPQSYGGPAPPGNFPNAPAYPGPQPYGGEAPPPYTPTPVEPSAPPVEKH